MKGFFQDKNGDNSMMRLLSFLIVIVGLALISFCTVWIMIYNTDQISIIGMLIGLVTTGLGAKWAQKITEKDNKKNANM